MTSFSLSAMTSPMSRFMILPDVSWILRRSLWRGAGVYLCRRHDQYPFYRTTQGLGSGHQQTLIEELRKFDLLQKGSIQIAGLNGLLLGLAKERDYDGVCVMTEVPSQTSRMENPMAALAILKTFMKLLDIEIDTKELAEHAKEMTEQIKQAMTIAMGEYIEHFTQPIWEQGEGEMDEEDEGEDEGNIGDQN